jgi:hypothetical protein
MLRIECGPKTAAVVKIQLRESISVAADAGIAEEAMIVCPVFAKAIPPFPCEYGVAPALGGREQS